MNAAELSALQPFALLAMTILALQLLLCVKRRPYRGLAVTVVGLLLTLWSLSIRGHQPAVNLTSLLVIDSYFVFFAQLFICSGLLISLMASHFLAQDKFTDRADEFYIFMLLVLLGALTLAASQHFVALFLGLELMSLALFPLLGFSLASHPQQTSSKEQSSISQGLEASIKYLLLSAISTAILLFGIACLYFQQGSLSFVSTSVQLPTQTMPDLISTLGFALVIIGVAFKLSLVPFHLWTADVYEGSPTPVTALIATVSKGAVLVVLMRFVVNTGTGRVESVWLALTVIAICSMLFGNLLALRQQHIKRVLAYSSIAHMGYILVALMLLQFDAPSSTGGMALEAMAFYLVAYFVTTIGAFAVVNQVSNPSQDGSYQLDYYRGLFWRSPWLATGLIFMLLSLAGIPLTMGFVGKFYLFVAGVQGKLWWLLSAVIAGSALGLYYYLQIIITLMKRASITEAAVPDQASTLNTWIIALLTTFLVFLGVYPEPLMSLLPTML